MMHGLDTNVIVRYVTQDDREQFRRADAVFTAAASSGDKLFINVIVMCEVVWVLSGAYREPRERIVPVIEALLETPEVVVEDADLARRALTDWRSGRVDFADCLIARRNERSGCQATLTFDKALTKSSLFVAP
jgi:predicted nucleic-acid-binding protein